MSTEKGEPVSAPETPAPLAEQEKVYARFRAKWLPILEPWANKEFTNPPYGGIQIEASADGGVDLIATDGSAMLVVHEPQPHGMSNVGLRIALSTPPALIKACREPKRPRLFDVNHDAPRYDMPDWLRPGSVRVLGLKRDPLQPVEDLVVVETIAQPPDEIREQFVDGAGLYSASQERAFHTFVDWQKALDLHKPVATTKAIFDPKYLALLRPLRRHLGACTLSLGGPEASMLATFQLLKEPGVTARALIMPIRPKAEGE